MRPGTSPSTFVPTRVSDGYSKRASACRLANRMVPASFTTSTASGDVSRSRWKRSGAPSAWVAGRGRSDLRRAGSLGPSWRRGSGGIGQPHAERCSGVGVFDPDAPAVRLHGEAAKGQTEAAPAGGQHLLGRALHE